MTDQERYYAVVMAYFDYSYHIPFDLYVAEIIGRFRQTGMAAVDCPDALYHALAERATQVEKEVDDGL